MAFSFSLAYLTVFDTTPSEAVEIAAKAGYSHVGFRLLPSASEGFFPIMSDDKLLRETQAALRDTGIKLADIEIIRIGEHFDLDGTKAFLERGSQLGAQHILVAGDDPNTARLTENYGAFCALANQFDMTADLEFMPWTKVPDIATCLSVVEGANQANGGILIDALHYDRAGMTPKDIAKIDPKWLHYVQFNDAKKAFDPSTEGLIKIAREARMNPSEGELDLVSLLRSIPQDMVLSLEVPNLEGAKTQSPLERAVAAKEGMQRVIDAAKPAW